MDSILIILVVILGLFIIGREIMMWYWKINKRIESLENIEMELRKISKLLDNIAFLIYYVVIPK